MKLTLLDIVQSVLSDINSDNVNSIGDTEEALQVASIVKDTYYQLAASRNWPTHRQLLQLNASGTTSRPTHIRLPADVHQVADCEIRYNMEKVGETRKRYEKVDYLYPDEFLDFTNDRNSDLDNIDIVLDVNGVDILIKTDENPSYWTSFDDDYIVFDSYDLGVDAALQNSKLQVMAYTTPSWSMSDTFIPDLPVDAFPLLLAEAKSQAFIAIKEIPNEKMEQIAQRHSRTLSRRAWRAKGGVRYPDYGRKSTTHRPRSTLRNDGY